MNDAGKVVGMVSDNGLLTRGGMNVTISLKRATDAEFVDELHESVQNPDRNRPARFLQDFRAAQLALEIRLETGTRPKKWMA